MLKKLNWHRTIRLLIFVLFAISLVYLAVNIKMGVSPDSNYHLEVSQAYSNTLGRAENTPATYQWRDISRIPYLYFWINGRVLNINNGVINEVILLRMINVLYSIATVYFTYLLSKEIFKNKWVRLLPTFFLTNTLMFLFLSSSINYDNLANLFSVLSILFFVKFVKSKIEIKYLFGMILFLCLGSLTKFTVLPLAFILILLATVEIWKKRKYLKEIKTGKNILLLVPILFLVVLNVELFGTNIIKYGSLEPKCEMILTHEQCLQNGVYYRDNITYAETDIDGVKGYFNLLLSGERIDPFRYIFKWLPDLFSKTFGIFADKSLFLPTYFTYIFIGFFFFSLLLSIINYKKWNSTERYLILISLFYIFVLFLFQNYTMYLRYNHYYLALQGRYLFPVISIIYILFTKSISFVQKKWIKYSVSILFIILISYSSIPFLLSNLPTDWIR